MVLINTFCSCCRHFFKLLYSSFKFRLSSGSFAFKVCQQTTAAATATGRTDLQVYSHGGWDRLATILSPIVYLISVIQGVNGC